MGSFGISCEETGCIIVGIFDLHVRLWVQVTPSKISGPIVVENCVSDIVALTQGKSFYQKLQFYV